MSTLEISKPLKLDTELAVAVSGMLAAFTARLATWRLNVEQRDLEAYLGAAQNMADLDRRLRHAQDTMHQTWL